MSLLEKEKGRKGPSLHCAPGRRLVIEEVHGQDHHLSRGKGKNLFRKREGEPCGRAARGFFLTQKKKKPPIFISASDKKGCFSSRGGVCGSYMTILKSGGKKVLARTKTRKRQHKTSYIKPRGGGKNVHAPDVKNCNRPETKRLYPLLFWRERGEGILILYQA